MPRVNTIVILLRRKEENIHINGEVRSEEARPFYDALSWRRLNPIKLKSAEGAGYTSERAFQATSGLYSTLYNPMSNGCMGGTRIFELGVARGEAEGIGAKENCCYPVLGSNVLHVTTSQ